jgi:hypothetical protein
LYFFFGYDLATGSNILLKVVRRDSIKRWLARSQHLEVLCGRNGLMIRDCGPMKNVVAV